MKKIRTALETASVRLAVWLLPKIPHSVVYTISQVLGFIAYVVDVRGRETAWENLRAAFRQEGINEGQVRRIALGSYQTFTLTFLDLFWSARLTKENFARYFRIRFDDTSVEELARQKGMIWVTPHFSSFEMVSLLWGFRGFPMVVVAQDFKNPALTEIFSKLREGSGNKIISQDGAMMRLVKTLARKGYAGLLTDLNIKPGKLAVALDCFGLQTCVTAVHTQLAMRLKVPIVGGVCLAHPDGLYDAHIHRALRPEDYKSPKEMAQALWDEFAKDIRKTPEAWLWMYKHWRYLPGKDIDRDPRYPAYANALRAFRELMAEE